MSLDNQSYNAEDLSRHLQDHCHRYMHHHVLLTRRDGSTFDGIIVNVDVDNVTVLMGEDIMMDREEEDIRYDGYGGYGAGYGRPRRRYRRYRPYRYPLGTLAGLALYPYQYPPYYPYSPYPYY
ncbi:hypothetical protein [Sediminibacillus albus]|uniref:LSM domain-containing protein n=1 Tax=Sediminibacillus albus TaxID=407036 RepID=A0A1G9C4Y7_9BACI|nr:hypothetical protein [Sediminibacillus albus]SDK46454.1 hypothetical protein SAMN05216243_3236 [Sediminibacillus albus]